jgi:hypothetical protein
LGIRAVVNSATRRLSRAPGDGTKPDRQPSPGSEPAELGGQGAALQAAAAQAAAGQAAAGLVEAVLVETDDAIRTSEQELGFATAKFGEHVTAPFSAALESARAELSAAVRIALLLDDNVPADEAKTRAYVSDIRAHCAAGSRLLDEQSDAFDQLQDLDARAPRLAAEVDAHVAQQTARINRSRQILERLVARYTADAVVAVMTNPDQAAERLEFAAHSLASARQELAEGQRGHAAVLLQAAEAGADQATDLLDAVEHLEAELTQAASALPGALREMAAEIAESAALPADRAQDERATVVASAQAVADQVRAQQAAGPIDALAALRDVQRADTALDHALAGSRAEPARRERAMAVLDQAMLVARSSVTAAQDIIRTRRGGVGAAARTRLIEAQRHFRRAISRAQTDPEAAVAEAQQADALALAARARAEHDVARFDYGQVVGSWRVEGNGSAGGFGAQVGGAVLGGILIVRQLSDGQCIGPASFGGTRTRDRDLGRYEHRVPAGLSGSR